MLIKAVFVMLRCSLGWSLLLVLSAWTHQKEFISKRWLGTLKLLPTWMSFCSLVWDW